MTFVIIPYIVDLPVLSKGITKIAPHDLKHTRDITESMLTMLSNDMFFSISVILEEDFYFSQFNKFAFLKLADDYIKMLNMWSDNQPYKKDYYDKVIKKFRIFKNEVNRKSFNIGLAQEIISLSFFVSYITYLLKKYIDIKGICWFSDRDKMTDAYNKIIYDLYEIQGHTFCVNNNIDYEIINGIGVPDRGSDKLWFDELVRIADYICGALADYNFENNGVTHKKHLMLHEKLIADNQNILIFTIKKDCVARVEFKSKTFI